MNNAEHLNRTEETVRDAFMLLLAGDRSPPISLDRFWAICKCAPQCALNLIERNRVSLMNGTMPHAAEIGQLVRTVEWRFIGASKYIERHRLDPMDIEFIKARLESNPEEFTSEDHRTLLRQFAHPFHPIRQTILRLMKQNVVNFADRITAEPIDISEDVASLKKSIRDYGFGAALNEALEKIDQELAQPADAFDQTATMKHIRSFFESLHESIGKELQAKRPNVGNGTNLSQCGTAIDYLERRGVTTEKIKNLGRCLYSILSDGDFGVHALKASRDYTRLCRNMVVEYAVTLFFELERRLAQPGDK